MGSRWKKGLVVIVIIIVVLFGGFFLYQFIDQKGSGQKFRTVRVERGEGSSSVVTATGTINPVITVLVGSQVSGTIKALHADFNSRVKEGEVIAQINPAIFKTQVEQGKGQCIECPGQCIECPGQS